MIINPIEITDKEVLIISEDVSDINQWIISLITSKILDNKLRLRSKWMNKLKKDDSIKEIPEDLDQCVDLILSREYFTTTLQERRKEIIKNSAKFEIM